MAGTTAPWASQKAYRTYRSAYGPKYKIQPNIGGWTVKSATKLWVPPDLRWERGHGGLDGDGGWEWRMDMDEVGMTLAGFGATDGFLALFFFGEVPIVRKDILSKVPFIGQRFIREIPASDNPF
ncbi:hypothetical protein VE04_08100 [Pseudogymnoascus sp. 24MN13]|nr:hypothetical protein VE04_08100 [Pseudogymnoascus sp. 24MN13]